MPNSNQSEEPKLSTIRQSAGASGMRPDPSWKGLYKAGGLCAFVYVIITVVIPALMVIITNYDFKMDGETLLIFIGSHKIWWMLLQTLVLGTSMLAIVTFTAMFVALKHINKAYALIGTIVTVTCQLLFMAYYPILLGLIKLSDQFKTAAEGQKGIITTAAEALIAQNNAFNPLYESLFALGILIFSIVMLKGVFHKATAYLGIANFPAAIIALSLWPILGVSYFWWWTFFMIWFIAVGWKLIKLSNT